MYGAAKGLGPRCRSAGRARTLRSGREQSRREDGLQGAGLARPPHRHHWWSRKTAQLPWGFVCAGAIYGLTTLSAQVSLRLSGPRLIRTFVWVV